MMNREYMKQTYADNLAAWREYRAQIAQDAETLCEIVQNHRFNGGTPEQAAREIVQAIGAENARVIIASAVNAHEGDGRLSAAVIEWAQGIGWDWEMSCNLGLTLDAKMHMCHVNQTAEAIMNLPEEPQPTEPTETEPTAEAAQNEEENTMQNVLNSIQNAAQKVIDSRAEFIRKEAQTAADIRNKWNLRDYCTPKQFDRLAAMQDAEPIPAADLDKMTAKAARKIERDAAKASDKAQTAAQLDAPEGIRLYITWTRSAVWGWNPHCCLTAWSRSENGYTDSTTHGSASGCGYDKTSAACAQALNASEMVRGALVRFVNDGGSNYGVYTAETLNYPVCPYFEGGCGMSTITETLRKMGYKVTDTTHYNRRGTEECRIIEAYKEEV